MRNSPRKMLSSWTSSELSRPLANHLCPQCDGRGWMIVEDYGYDGEPDVAQAQCQWCDDFRTSLQTILHVYGRSPKNRVERQLVNFHMLDYLLNTRSTNA